jgi:lipopolysaccharide export LptBFGC system permease protein LptF
VAAFRRPGENTRIADIILTLSFYVLLVGTMVFTWANMRKFVAIVLTVVIAFLAMAYLIVKDSKSGKCFISLR